jgi:gliding motility-associated protein GldL
MSLTEFLESPGYKKVMAKVYGIGAAVVLAGALFKIMHYPGAELMLLLGMGTEIVIFFLSAFEPPHEMPDWSLVYPELVGLETETPRAVSGGGGGGGSELAALIESGHLEQDVVEKLAEGLKKLTATTTQLADVSNASVATESYLQNMKQAGDAAGIMANAQLKTTKAIEESSNILSESYASTAKSMTEAGQKVAANLTNSGKAFTESLDQSGNQLMASYSALSQSMNQQFETINTNSKAYTEHLSGVNKNLTAINSAYELQLKGLNDQVQTTQELNHGLSTIKENLAQSVDDSKAYKEQVAALSQTIGELNTIYGNMLSAMNMGNR